MRILRSYWKLDSAVQEFLIQRKLVLEEDRPVAVHEKSTVDSHSSLCGDSEHAALLRGVGYGSLER